MDDRFTCRHKKLIYTRWKANKKLDLGIEEDHAQKGHICEIRAGSKYNNWCHSHWREAQWHSSAMLSLLCIALILRVSTRLIQMVHMFVTQCCHSSLVVLVVLVLVFVVPSCDAAAHYDHNGNLTTLLRSHRRRSLSQEAVSLSAHSTTRAHNQYRSRSVKKPGNLNHMG